MVNKSEQQKINALFGDQNRNEIKVIETKPDLNCDVHSNRRRTSSGGASLYSSRKNLSLLALNEQQHHHHPQPTTATTTPPPKKNTLTTRSTTNLNGGCASNGYGLIVNHNKDSHNNVVFRKKKLAATDLSPRTASIISSFGFDQADRRQSYAEGDKARYWDVYISFNYAHESDLILCVFFLWDRLMTIWSMNYFVFFCLNKLWEVARRCDWLFKRPSHQEFLEEGVFH